MAAMRDDFEVRYPLPEGMYRTEEGYAGHTNYWLYNELWNAWQASRAALRVELPECDPHEAVTFGSVIEQVKEALQQAGIEVVK